MVLCNESMIDLMATAPESFDVICGMIDAIDVETQVALQRYLDVGNRTGPEIVTAIDEAERKFDLVVTQRSSNCVERTFDDGLNLNPRTFECWLPLLRQRWGDAIANFLVQAFGEAARVETDDGDKHYRLLQFEKRHGAEVGIKLVWMTVTHSEERRYLIFKQPVTTFAMTTCSFTVELGPKVLQPNVGQ